MDARRPPKILAPTLIATKQLTDVLADGFSGIKICYPGQRAVTFTERMVQNFRNIANVVTESFYEWTTVRGILYQITWNDGVTRCRIRESLNHTEIPCLVTPELLNTVKDALPHRVDLYGRAKSNRLEGIMAIEVERVEILPDLEQSMQSTPAIHITGGMDSREYVERLRGG
jgi:hypothetical protein